MRGIILLPRERGGDDGRSKGWFFVRQSSGGARAASMMHQSSFFLYRSLSECAYLAFCIRNEFKQETAGRNDDDARQLCAPLVSGATLYV